MYQNWKNFATWNFVAVVDNDQELLRQALFIVVSRCDPRNAERKIAQLLGYQVSESDIDWPAVREHYENAVKEKTRV